MLTISFPAVRVMTAKWFVAGRRENPLEAVAGVENFGLLTSTPLDVVRLKKVSFNPREEHTHTSVSDSANPIEEGFAVGGTAFRMVASKAPSSADTTRIWSLVATRMSRDDGDH